MQQVAGGWLTAGALAGAALAFAGAAPAADADSDALALDLADAWTQPAPASRLSGLGIVLREAATAPGSQGSPGVTLSHLTRIPGAEQWPGLGAKRLHVMVAADDLRAIRYGVGFDLKVPAFGKFHLNLHSRDNAARPGKRWSLLLSDPQDSAAPDSYWSLGGSLKLTRPPRSAENPAAGRRLLFVPQFMLDVDGLTGLRADTDALIQYTHWRTGEGDVLADRAVQLSVRLRF